MTEKPRFKRAFTDIEMISANVAVIEELKRCYEIIAEAERMAEFYRSEKKWHEIIIQGDIGNAKDGDPVMVFDDGEDMPWKVARDFLERLSK